MIRFNQFSNDMKQPKNTIIKEDYQIMKGLITKQEGFITKSFRILPKQEVSFGS